MTAYVIESADVNQAEQTVVSKGLTARDAEVWQHHFPQFPVLPGVLMLDLLKATAEKWYGAGVRVINVRRVRFSNYLKPGAEWQGRMRLENLSSEEGDRWSGEILSAGVKMASAILTLSVKG